ncbi:MAG: hypothetical protein ACRD2Z_09030 [Thermoanaerobaculia bacterium]
MIHSRMSRRTGAAGLVLMLTALLTGGCIFDTGLSVTVAEIDGEILGVFISTNAGTSICDPVEGASGFECTFLAGEGGAISRFFIESLPEFLNLLILIDPLVVQFPAEASGFEGSFLHQGSGTNRSLSITSGLASVPVDDTRTLVAEPGTQLVTIELSPGVPTSGDYSFNLRFNVPTGTNEIVTKPLFTGRVELADGTVFQAPLFPCVSDMAQVPAITIPVPVPGDILNIPPPNPALACDGEVYQYGGGIPPVPALGRGGLLALLSALAGLGWLALHGLRRRPA